MSTEKVVTKNLNGDALDLESIGMAALEQEMRERSLWIAECGGIGEPNFSGISCSYRVTCTLWTLNWRAAEWRSRMVGSKMSVVRTLIDAKKKMIGA